jgi:hypothetical protein
VHLLEVMCLSLPRRVELAQGERTSPGRTLETRITLRAFRDVRAPLA